MEDLPEAFCIKCGNKIRPKQKNRLYCSKDCKDKDYGRRRYHSNPERFKQEFKDYYNRNKDKVLKRNSPKFKSWYEKNKAKQIAYVVAWRKKNAKRYKEYNKERYKKIKRKVVSS